MSATQGELADLSKFIFRAPNWYASAAFALVIAALAGIAAFEEAYFLEDAWQGIFFIGIPTLTATALTTPLDRWVGGQLTYNRSALLALTCEVVVVAVMVGAGGIALVTGYGQEFIVNALIAALGLVFAVRLVVVLAVSRNSWLGIAPAGVQTGTAAVLLFVYSGTMRYLEIGGPLMRSYLSRPGVAPERLLVISPEDFLMLAAVSALYAGAAVGTLWVIDRPWKRALGVSVFDFLRGFVGHIAEGTDELEDFFEQIGEEAVVPVTVLAFERPDGTEKARFVLPMIHPGPMGEIGGGNLPKRIAESADGLAFPPHATAGHDFNLVTTREVETVVDAARTARERIETTETATPGVRAEAGDASVLAQGFGSGAFLAATFAPGFADDVEYGVGLAAVSEARGAGLDDVMLADAHNSNNGLEGPDLGHVHPGSKRSFDVIAAAREAAESVANGADGPLELGTAWDPTPWTPAEGIGPLGVRVAVTEVAGHTTAYVLVDGNNMDPGVRARLRDAIEGVDAVEVMTTDTHVVNTLESVNQVGGDIDVDRLGSLVSGLVSDARADCEPVAAGMATERATVTVFGNDRTETLASHANTVVAMGGALVGSVVVAAMALSLLLFLLT
ncbi:MAG: DUF2070 family protein [Halobacteriaceae archaeon]